MIIPENFVVAFPWIMKPISKLKVSSPDTVWLEREIIRIIFNPKDELQITTDDPRYRLIKSLESEECDENSQVGYIKNVAKCLADAAVKTPLPKNTQDWLKDVNKKTKALLPLLRGIPKKSQPLHWNNLFSLNIELLNDTIQLDNSQKIKVKNILKEANRSGAISTLDAETHGVLDLVAILSLITKQSKELATKSAIEFYKYPQTFFNGISTDSTLFLEYQRLAIHAITLLNKSQFSKPYDSLTSYILSCVFQKEISKQSIKKIREKLVF